MNAKRKIFVVLGSLFLFVVGTLPLHPQVPRRRNAPITSEPPATPKKPTDLVVERPDPPAEPESRTYEKPRYMDDRLDWCLNWGFNCGKAAATAFCHRRRFENVTAFEPELIGPSAPTRLMGSDQVCNGDNCTGFAYITCSGPISMDRVFANPEWDGYRLDVCLMPGGYCGGTQAADRFCSQRGFSDSLDSTPDRDARNSPTRFSGTGEICRTGCKGFQQIICRSR